jgi:hypothetical protein
MSHTQKKVHNSPLDKNVKMLKCADDVIGKNTASMHRGFRPKEGFLCCVCVQ